MDNALFRRNVLKVIGDPKQFKSGLKLVSTKTSRAQALSACISVAVAIGAFTGAMGPYLSGASKLTDQIRGGSFDLLATAAMHLNVLAKFTKAKIPGAGKKAGLKDMTRTEGILLLNSKATELLASAQRLLYPTMQAVEKVKKVYDKKEDGSKAETFTETPYSTQQADKDASNEAAMVFEEELRAAVSEFAALFSQVCNTTFDVPVANLHIACISALEQIHGKGFFELADSASEEEADSAEAAAG